VIDHRHHESPKLAKWLLRRVFPDVKNDATLGDFEEVYSCIVEERGVFRAKIWYWIHLLTSVWSFIVGKVIWNGVMIQNYIKITLRNLKKSRGYSFINIIGLAVGMACCGLIFLWVQDELSYDRFHRKADHLYRLTEVLTFTDGTIQRYAISADNLGIWLQGEYPDIVNTARFFPGEKVLVSHGERRFYEQGVCMVDPSFLTMFSFPLRQGDPVQALSRPDAVILTRAAAEKYFGGYDPIGQTLTIEGEGDFQVSGILEQIPSHSHLRFDFLVPVTPQRRLGIPRSRVLLPFTYVQLDEKADADDVMDKIRDVFPKFGYTPATVRIGLQPLKRVHLHSDFDWDMEGHGSIVYVRIFTVIALFILIIACINFINLATARSVNRAREVGIRKVMGGRRSQLIHQFYGESTLMCVLALAAALFLISLFLPLFNELTAKQLTFSRLFHWRTAGGILLMTCLTAFISGSYPAFFLSSFQPAAVLKSQRTAVGTAASFRRVLVIVQFTLSVVLIIGSLIVSRQLDFFRHNRLGFDKQHVIYLDVQNFEASKLQSLKQALSPYPHILSATIVSEIPVSIDRATDALDWEGKQEDDNILMRMFRVDDTTLDVFRFEMAEGRYFSKRFQTDITGAYVVNQTAVRAMGMTDPIGKRFTMWRREGRIIGVVKDFHFKSLHQRIEPLIMHLFMDWNNYMCIRCGAGMSQRTIETVAKEWKRVFPEQPFEVHFLDQAYDRLYQNDERIGSLFHGFTRLAVFVSCLGLLGLAAFAAEQRTKEIGIRKVLGSSVMGIILLLTREFMKWILVANVIAWPMAWFAMNRWLENFAYRIRIRIDYFILAGCIAFLTAFLTVLFQSIRAARANPVDSLKYE